MTTFSHWAYGRLTTRQAAQVLTEAGLNPDPATWSGETTCLAALALDVATRLKQQGKTFLAHSSNLEAQQ